MAQSGRGAGWLAVLMIAFIVYGSLYPFRFHPLPAAMGPVEAVAAILGRGLGGRGDLLANAVLYAPLGFALVAAGRGVLAATLLCAALSGAIEVTQLFLPNRYASIWDLALNAAGALAGALAARNLGPAQQRPGAVDGAAALLVGAWICYRLYPFVPAIDRGEWVRSIRPLFGAWPGDPVRALRLAGAWLIAARLLDAALPRAGLLGAATMMLATTAAAIPIVDRVLMPPEILAIAVALPLWALLRRRPGVDGLLAVVMLAVVLAEGLAPYTFSAGGRPFGWVPFAAMVGGQYAAGLQAALLKAFLYGGLLWLALRADLRFGPSALAVALLALAIGVAQTHLPERSGEVSDALMALAAALVLRPVRGK